MKKLICLILALMFTVMFATMAMAATENIGDETVPAAQYEEFDEDDIAQGTDSGPPESEITDDKLPQTGGIPAEVYYVIGGILILSAVLLLGKKTKPSAK